MLGDLCDGSLGENDTRRRPSIAKRPTGILVADKIVRNRRTVTETIDETDDIAQRIIGAHNVIGKKRQFHERAIIVAAKETLKKG